MDAFKALPEPAKAGAIGASLGAAAAYAMSEGDSLVSYALGYGAATAIGSHVAPMVTLDPMYQIAVAGATGAAAQFAAPLYVPGSMLMAAAVPAGSLYLSRAMAS